MELARYSYEDFIWHPARNSKIAVNHLIKNKADAIHLSSGIDGTEDLAKILDAAKVADCLEALFIPYNDLKNAGCVVLGDFLKQDGNLMYLYLERNSIKDTGVVSLLEGLNSNPQNNLQALFLGDNEITNEGVKVFAQFLETDASQNLKEFSIGRDFDDEGALYIAKALSRNQRIRGVFLNNNNMTALGSKVIAEVASRHETCTNVQVSSANVTADDFVRNLKDMTAKELRKAFEQAVRNDEKGKWNRSKIMVVGQGRAGKTATVRSLLGKVYDENLDSTVGAEITQSNTGKQWAEQNSNEKVDFTKDAAARLAALKLAKNRTAAKQVLDESAFSIEDTIKFYQDQQTLEEAELQAKRLNPVSNVLDEEEINKKFDAQLVTNKKAGVDDIAFTIWDYGGQEVFYTLHHLFLTKYGIYILCFDMREVVCINKNEEEKIRIQKQTREYLLFWLNSVYMHAAEAPLMIIGTFLDQTESQNAVAEVHEFVENLTVKFQQVVRNGGLSFFPLSNSAFRKNVTALLAPFNARVAGSNIDVIRDTIEYVARQQAFVNRELSLRWVKTLDALLAQPESYLTVENVRAIASNNEVADKDVDAMLAFFHELGMIVHLTATQNLRNIVTTKPQWLIQALSKVIRDKVLHGFPKGDITKAGVDAAFDLMIKKSIVTSDWLEFVWEKSTIPFMIDLMRRTMLISDWKYTQAQGEVCYLVPSLLHEDSAEAKDIARKYLVQFEVVERLTRRRLRFNNERPFSVFPDQQLPRGRGMKKFLAAAVPNFQFQPSRQTLRPKKLQGELYGILLGDVNRDESYDVEITYSDQAVIEEFNEQKEFTDPEDLEMQQISVSVSAMNASQKNLGPKGNKVVKRLNLKPRLFGFKSDIPVGAVVFDFRHSFLPNGVFQRLLCLCIMKAMNTAEEKGIHLAEPVLYKTSAVVQMDHRLQYSLFQQDLQILCIINDDHFNSFRILESMMSKLRADVMGTALEWEVFMEVELDAEEQKRFSKVRPDERGTIRQFIPKEEAKAIKAAPWYAERSAQVEDIMINVAGLELEAFLNSM